MKQEEMNQFIRNRFKNINESFHKAIENFEVEDICKFRNEIRKLKVFLHLVSMESEDGLSCQITRRMRIIYGYLGIIQNFHLQLEEASEYVRKSPELQGFYLEILEKQFESWKNLSKEYVDSDYNFEPDENEILSMLPDKLTDKSIISFINYLLYEISETSSHQDDEALNTVRKFMEDIYYNLPFFRPFVANQQKALFEEKELRECLNLFEDYDHKRTNAVLLKMLDTDDMDEQEKQIIKQMEKQWLLEKGKIKMQLAAKLNSMHIRNNHLNQLSLQNSFL
jgi:hypothetical protein